MPFLIAGLLLFWLATIGLRTFVRANPVVIARAVKRFGGLAAIAVGVLMLLRGRIDVAIALVGFGWWLSTGRRLGGFGRAFGAWPRASRRVSRVRSAMIEMELDHASGQMSGTVLAGPDEGAALDQLSRSRCFALHARSLVDDPEGARLLEAYFDRRFAGWREAGHDRNDAGSARAPGREAGRRGSMTEEEAHEILGLSKSATRDEITRAHRALMKKLHPDHGGSTALAARVNEAKDVLMRRHP